MCPPVAAGGHYSEIMLQAFGARPGAHVYTNTVPATVIPPGSGPKIAREMFFGKERRKPSGRVPIVRPGDWDSTAADGLSVVWLGHATTLVEIEGRRVLIDPVWSLRCSPVSFAGPRRLHPMPLPLGQLPSLDAILISHDHYDHLDMPTVLQLASSQQAPFLVPAGVGAHLRRWGVSPDRIIEFTWDQSYQLNGIDYVMTEARHFSGRLFTRNRTLWGSWVIAGQRRKVFYTGDTGYFPGFAEIGRQHGPFDLTLIQIGAYSPYWPDIHMTPDEAVATHTDVQGGLLLPVHWATFNLALHSWSEPVDRIWSAAKEHEIKLAVPRPGERVLTDDPLEVDGWWQAVA
jgi:L-ascorbate metabolism protein UlaG (beta-lactamase superfamily)